MREALVEALSGFAGGGLLRNCAVELFGALGYCSERMAEVGSVDQFVALLESGGEQLTDQQRALFDSVRNVEIVFQFTVDEITTSPGLFDRSGFDDGRMESFLFLAFDMDSKTYARARLIDITRTVNRRFPMPVILLFRHGSTLTLAVVHRRPNKRDASRDVLERITLVKDIRFEGPHRAHVEILADLALTRLNNIRNFDDLHAAWETALDIERLNRNFYRELFEWFQRAVRECTFPDDGAGAGSEERYVIRLITRFLFIWFLKEKGLVPPELFEESFARSILREHAPDSTDYYRAVLQNLFFATLNAEIGKRGFQESRSASPEISTGERYLYRDLLAEPKRFVAMLSSIPFVNGGLFDCLDKPGRRIDDYAEEEWEIEIPARLFFDKDNGLFSLFHSYKFTVEENTPLDQEVALDPELLGRVFENLLAAYNPETRDTARKSTGSYYTPRAVVNYMIRETLAETLSAKCRSAGGGTAYWRKNLLDLLDHSHATVKDFTEREKRTIIAAIADLRVLDPAVGSGAFPMGVLQTLTLALRRLDPENALWETLQKELAIKRAGDAFENQDRQLRDQELREIGDTFDRYRQTDYGRKLYLIQNCIYGVDIQPIACQIAKLRFFISLAIEQEANPDAPNLGIRPLPNLETRFIAANTLIGLKADTDSLLIDNGVTLKRKELAAVRGRYFLADSRNKKIDSIREETRVRNELLEKLEIERCQWDLSQKKEIEDMAESLPNTETREKFRKIKFEKFDARKTKYDRTFDEACKVTEWNPYDQNAHADWFDSEWMFGISGGFDVVIGNPPYVEARNSLVSEQAKTAYGSQLEVDWGRTLPRGSDLLIYFYARSAVFLQKEGGVGCFITQNAWLNTDYGLEFQSFTEGRFSFFRIIDTSAKFFSDPEGPNINAIISLFTRKAILSIEHATADTDMVLREKRTYRTKAGVKWGHQFSMPEVFDRILSMVSVDHKSSITNQANQIRFGQGINVPKSKLDEPGGTLGVIFKAIQFVVDRPDGKINRDYVPKTRRPPALVMPRGVGDRYYCSFNSCKALSFSAVEFYLPDDLWGSDLHYCIWVYFNSSFVYLFREITGRKNLGGGLLKAEATDMKRLPMSYEFDFAAEAKEVFQALSKRDPLPINQEIFTEEHLFIDEIIGRYFNFSNELESIRSALIEQVEARIRRSQFRG